MSEQANTTAHDVPSEAGQDARPEAESSMHRPVRTERETNVDDALGATDEPE
jgi:hypothetical protein